MMKTPRAGMAKALAISFLFVVVSATSAGGLAWPTQASAASASSPIYPGAAFGDDIYVHGLHLDVTTAALVDVNGDGKVDAVGYGYTDNSTGTVYYDVVVMFGNGDGTFAAAKTYDINYAATGLQVADVNGDKSPDIVVALDEECTTSCIQHHAELLLNNGDGTFGTAQPLGMTLTVDHDGNFVLRDLNGDGKPDLLAGTPNADTAVYLGNGDGTFGSALTMNLADTVYAVSDLDGDGKPDLAACMNVVTSTCTLMKGNGDGTFTKKGTITFSSGTSTQELSVHGLQIADMNGDGKKDLVAAVEKMDISNPASPVITGVISVALGNGDLTFSSSVDAPVTSGAGGTFAIADFNNDGKPDVAAAGLNANIAGFGTTVQSSIYILLGKGDGTFNVGGGADAAVPGGVFAADLNGDGNTDLVTVSSDMGSGAAVLLGNGDGTLQSRAFYVLKPAPASILDGANNDVHLGDIDGDGDLDIVMSNVADTTVTVYQNNGKGTFKALAPVTVGVTPVEAAVGDMNNDGNADIVTVNSSASAPLSVLVSNGDGTFAAPVNYSSGVGDPSHVVLGDLNNDGYKDVILSNAVVLLNQGDGTLGAGKSFTYCGSGNVAGNMALGDFDGDGNLDLVMGDCVLHGTGSGSFDKTLLLKTTDGKSPTFIAVGDVNNDGNLDIVGIGGTPTVSGWYAVFLGNGDGTFKSTKSVQLTSTDAYGSPALADINGDGNLDLLTGGEFRIGTWLGNGDGTFTQSFAYAVPSAGPKGPVLADLNGDSVPDIVAPLFEPNGMTVLLATHAAAANSPPVASAGTLTTNENTAANGTLSASDSDGDALTFSIVTQPAHGTVKVNNAATGAYTYTPSSNYTGSDSFTFKANDGKADSNTATVSITVKSTSSGGGSGSGSGSSGGSSGGGGAFAATTVFLLAAIALCWSLRRRQSGVQG